MGIPAEQLLGQRFGRWTVVDNAGASDVQVI